MQDICDCSLEYIDDESLSLNSLCWLRFSYKLIKICGHILDSLHAQPDDFASLAAFKRLLQRTDMNGFMTCT